MLLGRLFQSRGAVIMKDRSPMVAFVKRFGVLDKKNLQKVSGMMFPKSFRMLITLGMITVTSLRM